MERHAIVAIGDSITDGSGTTIDGNDRWKDFLNKRLRAAGSANVVVNQGIGGNRIVTLPWGPVLSGAYLSDAKLANHYYGFAYDQIYPDLTQQQINTWMRTSKTFDAVFDFDAAVRDPDNPARIKADYSAPDHIHLNPAGYEKAASIIPMSDLDAAAKP